jgi:hypothetical protein
MSGTRHHNHRYARLGGPQLGVNERPDSVAIGPDGVLNLVRLGLASLRVTAQILGKPVPPPPHHLPLGS